VARPRKPHLSVRRWERSPAVRGNALQAGRRLCAPAASGRRRRSILSQARPQPPAKTV